jgi:CubicO group peptidase (beta-lactamase class C family)
LPYAEAVARDILEPLGMHDSEIVLRWPPSAPRGYRVCNGAFETVPEVVDSVPPTGGLYTTLADLAKFVDGWRSLLPRALWREALAGHVNVGKGAAQGYGWFVTGGTKGRIVGHSGGMPGFASSLLWDRERGLISIVAMNREEGPAVSLNRALLSCAFKA